MTSQELPFPTSKDAQDITTQAACNSAHLSGQGLDRGLHHAEPNAVQQHIHSQIEGSIIRSVQLLADPLHSEMNLAGHIVPVCALLQGQPGVVWLAVMQPHHWHPHLKAERDHIMLY